MQLRLPGSGNGRPGGVQQHGNLRTPTRRALVTDRGTKGIPVLMYHALEDEANPAGAKDVGEQRYVQQVHQFREQMAYLHREGYRTFLFEELQVLKEWPD